LDVAKRASKAATEGIVKKSIKGVGLVGAVVGVGMAAKHIWDGNWSWHDVVAMGLGVASAALLLTPVGEALESTVAVATVGADGILGGIFLS